MAPLMQEKERSPELVTSRIPVGPVSAAEKATAKDPGAQAVTDAIVMVLACWAVLFFLAYSLRKTNI